MTVTRDQLEHELHVIRAASARRAASSAPGSDPVAFRSAPPKPVSRERTDMTFDDLLNAANRSLTAERGRQEAAENRRTEIRSTLTAENRGPSADETTTLAEVLADINTHALKIAEIRGKVQLLEAEMAQDAAATKAAEVRVPGASLPGRAPARVGAEPADVRSQWVRAADGAPAEVRRGQRFADHDVVARQSANRTASEAAVIGQHGSLGNLVRAMSTTSGSAIVPTTWSANLIDLARSKCAVIQAGASLIPMDAKVVQVGRLTGDPTAAFRDENSPVTASDPTFDNVTLTAKTMSTLVIGSLEWFQDADNADSIVVEAIAQAIAQKLDIVGLYGSIVAGAGAVNLPTPPNPRGVLGALNALLPGNVLGAAANGTAQTAGGYFNELIDLIFKVRNGNEEPTGLVYGTRLAQQYAKAYDTTGQPLALPAAVSEVPQFTSNQVPVYTQGTMVGRATDVFAADWSQLLIGQRLDLTIQTLVERYADNGQIGIVAHWRGDVQVARPAAFAVYKAIQGSA